MNNFDFFNPTRLIFGRDEITKLKNTIPLNKRILMLYGGGSIKQNGVYQQVRQSLADHVMFEFGGIEANPRYDTLKPAIELVRQEKIDFFLAVGGGSVIDATKFVAAAVPFQGEAWDILAKRTPIERALEFGCVLTLPATGSEMNCFSVISHGKDKLGFGNPLLYPKFSILDPSTTFSLSERQLGNGIVDAFVHTTEQYLTNNNNTPLQDRMAEGILQTLIEEADKILFVKDNYEARANLMFSATMALNGLIGMGTNHDWATHMIGHELTALYGIDHARTLALILPSLLQVQREQKREKLVQYAQRVWNIPLMDYDKMIDAAIVKTEDFFNHVGVPTKLKYYKIEKSDFPKIVAQVRQHIPINLGENRDINDDKITQILNGAY